MIAASLGRAAAGTIGANYEHYVDWKDTTPRPKAEIAAELGSELNSHQMLIAGMLNTANLIDILRNFTLFKTSGGRTIKLVPRYQQYRAVHEAIGRLLHKQTRLQHGTDDQRGGIIWHTQGSGKSLTMVYLIRKIRTIPALRRFKIVVVTDRTDARKATFRYSNTYRRTVAESENRQQEINIERFKKPLEQDSLAILVVKSMLLTGFDAPLEQVLYLDRGMKEYELLQAIARVNRVDDDTKKYGLVVDYYGVNLAEALAIYDQVDTEAAWFDIRDELPKLRDRQQRVIALFTENGCTIDDLDTCVDLLRDERLRVEFNDYLKDFLDTLDTILPRPEARHPYNFVKDAKQLGLIKKSVADLYRDEKLNIVSAKVKIRALIDQYIESQGIDPKVPPIDIMSLDFKTHVQRHRSIKAQAAEMEFVAKYYITTHIDEDPVYYNKLSDRLTEILESLADNWEEKVKALRKYIEEIQAGCPTNETGLDPKTQLPFLNILGEHSERELPQLASATVEIVKHIRQEVRRVNWASPVIQEDLRKWIADYLDTNDLVARFETTDCCTD